MLRKLKRSIARHNMEQRGITQLNKRPMNLSKTGVPVRLDSKFSKHWRDYV